MIYRRKYIKRVLLAIIGGIYSISVFAHTDEPVPKDCPAKGSMRTAYLDRYDELIKLNYEHQEALTERIDRRQAEYDDIQIYKINRDLIMRKGELLLLDKALSTAKKNLYYFKKDKIRIEKYSDCKARDYIIDFINPYEDATDPANYQLKINQQGNLTYTVPGKTTKKSLERLPIVLFKNIKQGNRRPCKLTHFQELLYAHLIRKIEHRKERLHKIKNVRDQHTQNRKILKELKARMRDNVKNNIKIYHQARTQANALKKENKALRNKEDSLSRSLSKYDGIRKQIRYSMCEIPKILYPDDL